MPSGARHAALLAALLCLALAIPAAAAERPPQLVAQIAQATPEPSPGEQPELSDEPPTELEGGSEDSARRTTAPAEDDGGGTAGSDSDAEALPDTGSEAADARAGRPRAARLGRRPAPAPALARCRVSRSSA